MVDYGIALCCLVLAVDAFRRRKSIADFTWAIIFLGLFIFVLIAAIRLHKNT